MSALAIRMIAASTMVMASCALPLAPTASGDIGRLPIPQLPCNLPSARSFIIWHHAPRAEDTAEFAPESDMYSCKITLETWRAGQPAGPGYCSKIAWAIDNPNYTPNVYPAPPLKKVIDQVGDC